MCSLPDQRDPDRESPRQAKPSPPGLDPRALTPIDPNTWAEIEELSRRRTDPGPRGLRLRVGEHTLRTVGGTIFIQRATQTFHEFLVDHLAHALGEQWWTKQGRKRKQRHVVADWFKNWHALILAAKPADHVPGVVYRVQPTGDALSLLVFADDVYRLSVNRRLPERLLARLRRRGTFQGARYEIAIAAMLLRAGWEIEWIDESQVLGGCELVATLGKTKFALEAKSRHRAGVYHQKGTRTDSWDVDVKDALSEARRKTTGGLPLVVFIDVNVPHGPGLSAQDKAWVRLAKDRLGAFTRAPREDLLVLTNFAWHRDGSSLALLGEYVVDPLGVARLEARVVSRIEEQLQSYGALPRDP